MGISYYVNMVGYTLLTDIRVPEETFNARIGQHNFIRGESVRFKGCGDADVPLARKCVLLHAERPWQRTDGNDVARSYCENVT